MNSDGNFAAFQKVVATDVPVLALVLGSGLGQVPDNCETLAAIGYHDIPSFPQTSVVGHAGQLTYARLAGQPILIFRGRFHRYEGFTWGEVVRPVELAHSLGARTYLATNAAGGIADDLEPGSLMQLIGHRWWLTPREAELLHEKPYDRDLIDRLKHAAQSAQIQRYEGIYGTVFGPAYETPAEIRAMRAHGVDAVGMSTAHEIERGHELGMACGAISCITNRAAGLSGQPLDHGEVLVMAASQSERLSRWLQMLMMEWPSLNEDHR